MNFQLYYLIKDKPKFNEIRFKYFQCLKREVITTEDNNKTEIFSDAKKIITIEIYSKIQYLYVNRDQICDGINSEHGCGELSSNKLFINMITESLKIRRHKIEPIVINI